ncbi:CinA family protein [Nitratifractor sp.]
MEGRVEILYIGAESYRHPTLQSYLHRELDRAGLRIVGEHYRRTHDSELPLLFQQLLGKEGADLLICGGEEAFTLAGRILSTLADDTLRFNGELLLPAAAEASESGSYLYRLGKRRIQVLRLEAGEEIPSLLLEPVGSRSYHFFTEDGSFPDRLLPVLLAEEENLEAVEIFPGWWRLRLYGEENLSPLNELLHPWRDRMIPGHSLVESLIRYLAAEGKKITFAESCTGGLLAATFTSEPGASEILEGSWVTYANRIKSGWLGVREETLREYGAVSAQCVEEMARGAQERVAADIAIAISGIAGPTGAVPGKPIGTVYLSLRNGGGMRTLRLQLRGDRNAIQQQAVLCALKSIVESEEKIFDFFSKNS